MTPFDLFIAAVSEAGFPPDAVAEHLGGGQSCVWVPGHGLPESVAHRAIEVTGASTVSMAFSLGDDDSVRGVRWFPGDDPDGWQSIVWSIPVV